MITVCDKCGGLKANDGQMYMLRDCSCPPEKTDDARKLNAQASLASATCYTALAEKAYVHAQGVAAKANGMVGYDRPWSLLAEPHQKGYVAFVKYVIKNQKRYNDELTHGGREASDCKLKP
jgi:hypothetical protein